MIQQNADSYKKIDEIFHHEGLPFISKASWLGLISRDHNKLLAGHFGSNKIFKLLAQKYYWPIFYHTVKPYLKGCDICLALKTDCHKAYSNLQLLLVLLHQWKNLFMNFMTGLPISINWNRYSYDSILVIIDWLIKMVYYKAIKITINALKLTEVIINVVLHQHSNWIVTDWGFLFISKFGLSRCYFFNIKRHLFTASIQKLIAKLKAIIVPWKLTSKLLSISSRTIGRGSYQWPSLLLIMPKTQVLAISFSSWSVAIILASFLKKIPIFAPFKYC